MRYNIFSSKYVYLIGFGEMRISLEKFGQEGAKEIQLMVRPSNEAARDFHQVCPVLSIRISNHENNGPTQDFTIWRDSEDLDRKFVNEGDWDLDHAGTPLVLNSFSRYNRRFLHTSLSV